MNAPLDMAGRPAALVKDYETLAAGNALSFVVLRWLLVMADDPATIALLEGETGMTQDEAVNDLIENSCWGEDVPEFVGGQGTVKDRRAALRLAYHYQKTMGGTA